MKTKLPWTGGKQQLTPKQVQAFRKIQSRVPFSILYCGKSRGVHLYKDNYDFCVLTMADVKRLRPLLHPRRKDDCADRCGRFIEYVQTVRSADGLQLRIRPDGLIYFFRA